MKIEMTEELWHILNPENGVTAWMFSNDQYFELRKVGGTKCFAYYDERLKQPLLCYIDKMFYTAGTLVVEDDMIMLVLKDKKEILWSNKVIKVDFKR